MNHDTYETLRVSRRDAVAHVTIANPPINVLSVAVMTDLGHLLSTLAGDKSIRVIVFDSADPDFFLAHVDMTAVTADRRGASN